MGHYDEQREFDDYQNSLRRDKKLIEDVKSGKFGVLLHAADIANSNTVMVNRDTFARMISIISRLDPKTYTYPWER